MLLLSVSACSSNPKEGGFFDGIYGMSTGQYQQRIEKRENEYQKISDANKVLSEQRESLEEQKQRLVQREQSYRKQLAAIQNDVNDLKNQLHTVSLTKQEMIEEKNMLEKQLTNLNAKVQKAKKANEQGLEIKSKLMELRKEKERIKKQIISLTS